MRVLVAGYGSTGDTQPLLALAVGLSRAGHDVVLVTDEAAVEAASEHDLDCRVLAGSARSVVTEGSHGWSGYMETGRPTTSPDDRLRPERDPHAGPSRGFAQEL